MSSSLPYTDTKPQGSPDFYFVINATFRFIRQRLGEAGLKRYWEEIGRSYYAPVAESWRLGGLPAVLQYWRDFFAAEPLAEVEVTRSGQEVRLDVRKCPAIRHLRMAGRTIDPDYCRHCYFVSESMASRAGLTVRVDGGNGKCRQKFLAADLCPTPQDMDHISSCS